MKSIFIKLILMGLLFIFTNPGRTQNILSDGGFNSTTSIFPYTSYNAPAHIWSSWINYGAEATPSIQDGICKYKITNGGAVSWEVQLIQWGFPLELGKHYRLSFDVKADANRSFGVFIGEDGGLWTNLNTASYTQQATNSWQTKTIEFDATAVFAFHKLSFEMGNSNINMYFDNIILEKLGNGYSPAIEIIGTSVPPNPWVTGKNLPTMDGVTYTLLNYYLAPGEVKFRQDANWAVNWGNFSFPQGYGYQGGPNIPVIAGTYNIVFNRLTGQYKFFDVSTIPAIGILGSAVNGWVNDVDMETLDGENYTLTNYTLENGEAKFRQNNSWDINWGFFTFPTGYSYQNGPNIPVVAGIYNISFNRYSGYYNFALVNCPNPVIQCSGNLQVDAEQGSCGATVWYNWPWVTSTCGYAEVIKTDGLYSGAFFPVGTSTVSFLAISSTHQTSACSFIITVKDNQPPVISAVTATPAVLWPANHKMQKVTVNYGSYDNCGTVNNTLKVSSNEPVNGTGDGDTSPDWIIQDDHHVLLRAERSGNGNGRVYTITITSTDAAGNTSDSSTTVLVPHDNNRLITTTNHTINPSGALANTKPNLLFSCKVIPNPSSGYFTLYSEIVNDQKTEVNLFDISGRLITKMQILKNQPLRFGDDLKPGIYLVDIKQADQHRMIKVVKL